MPVRRHWIRLRNDRCVFVGGRSPFVAGGCAALGVR
jgi:hypothetical protein